MKINFIPIVIAFAASALIAYGFYSGCRAEDICLLVTILGGFSLFLTLGTTFGVSFSRSRTTQNVKAGSGFFCRINSGAKYRILLFKQFFQGNIYCTRWINHTDLANYHLWYC